MGKKLLTDDYNEIVKGAFKIDESDFHNYYLNIVNEHYESNNDIAEKLIEFVEKWADGFRGYVIDHDNAILSYDMFKAWNAGGLFFPLPNNLSQQLGIIRQVNKPFFDGQSKILEDLDSLIKFRDTQRGLERIAPNIVVEATDQLCPYADELDVDKIKQRNAMLNLVWEKYKEKEKTQPTEKEPAETAEQNGINYCIPTSQIDNIHRLCNQHDLMESMDIADFIRLFDLNNTPAILPVFKRGGITRFCYILSRTEITKPQVKSNFGINNYHENIRNANNSSAIPQQFKNAVGRIFTPNVNMS